MWKRHRWVLLILSVSLLIGMGVVIRHALRVYYAMHGSPRQIKAYTHTLETLPTPPGWQPQTDRISLSSGAVYGDRDYKVAAPYEEVLEFFKTELPRQGWSLLKSEHHNQDVWLLFYSEEQYCLRIVISKWVTNETGKRHVSINIYAEQNKNHCRLY